MKNQSAKNGKTKKLILIKKNTVTLMFVRKYDLN